MTMFNIVSRFGAKNFVFYWRKKYGQKMFNKNIKKLICLLFRLSCINNEIVHCFDVKVPFYCVKFNISDIICFKLILEFKILYLWLSKYVLFLFLYFFKILTSKYDFYLTPCPMYVNILGEK